MQMEEEGAFLKSLGRQLDNFRAEFRLLKAKPSSKTRHVPMISPCGQWLLPARTPQLFRVGPAVWACVQVAVWGLCLRHASQEEEALHREEEGGNVSLSAQKPEGPPCC